MKEYWIAGDVKNPPFRAFIVYMALSILLMIRPILNIVEPLVNASSSSMSNLVNRFNSFNRLMLASLETALNINYWQIKYKEELIKNENNALKLEELSLVKNENKQLMKLLGLTSSYDLDFEIAHIIAKNEEASYPSLLINKGSAAGLAPGMVVLGFTANESALIGRVNTVNKRSSIIITLFNNKTHISARIKSTRYDGLVQMNETNNLTMNFVSRLGKEFINIGDTIVSSGLEESLYPANLPIARVKDLIDINYNPSLSLILEPIVDPHQVEFVGIIINNKVN